MSGLTRRTRSLSHLGHLHLGGHSSHGPTPMSSTCLPAPSTTVLPHPRPPPAALHLPSSTSLLTAHRDSDM
ncbi:hypothetical protein E2C01_026971 [Portunus trituberculatus]|uniref:Uncharacterized protein n=1 Tax=Portunus trituberculatus TaxID=210409 RepID=A0A5B7EKB1_PORTR|nr:hypothetical protein [Portunus trituberculatus]